MKKLKFGTVAVAAVLALGGGSLFATESLLSTGQVDTKIEAENQVTFEIEDEEILEAYKNGKVEVILEPDTEDKEGLKVDKNEEVEMESDELI